MTSGQKAADLDGLTSLIRVGVHKNVGVDFSGRWTEPEQACTVQQVYCSACSCSYSGMSNQLWEKFARMVLHANYEATLLAAAGHEGGSGHVFLTFIGGGVFRNDMAWIVEAISRAVWNVSKIGNVQLQVHVCHYREVPPPLPSQPPQLRNTPLQHCLHHVQSAFYTQCIFFLYPLLL